MIVFALIGLTTVHPLAPILLSSFALSTNAITFIASIPVLVGNDALLGTAFGVWKAFVSLTHEEPDYLLTIQANCNSIILEVAAGAIVRSQASLAQGRQLTDGSKTFRAIRTPASFTS